MPQRIQRRRTKGWRKPEGAVYVGRGSRWGNPFSIGDMKGASTGAREQVVEQYREWLTMPCEIHPQTGKLKSIGGSWPAIYGVPYEGRPAIPDIQAELAGKDLMCFCPDSQPCHADVLLDIANQEGCS